MKKIIATTTLVLSISLLSGCASIVDGTSQNVSVETPPVSGASCSLKNDKGSWYIRNTPGSTVVHKSTQPIFINCKKKGYKTSYQNFRSSTKGMIAGNVIFGGFIGAGVDAADGAAFDYPPTMIVPMKKH